MSLVLIEGSSSYLDLALFHVVASAFREAAVDGRRVDGVHMDAARTRLTREAAREGSDSKVRLAIGM